MISETVPRRLGETGENNSELHGPRISIITPSYNQAQFIEQTILSVVDQGYANLEYIIIDGGSTDGSVDIIRKYEEYLAYWVSEPDRGQAQAINKGFARATGDILAWINSDDYYCENALRTIVEVSARCSMADIFYGGLHMVNHDGSPQYDIMPPPFSMDKLLHMDFVPQPTVFIRKSVLNKIGPLNENLHYSFDYEYWLRAALQGISFMRVPKYTASFRLHTDSKTTSKQDLFLEERFALTETVFECGDKKNDLSGYKSKFLAFSYLETSIRCRRNNDLLGMKSSLLTAIRFHPRLLIKLYVILSLVYLYLPKRITKTLIAINKRIKWMMKRSSWGY